MKLIADIGNTLVKIALFEKDEMVFLKVFSLVEDDSIAKAISEYSLISSCWLAAVREIPPGISKALPHDMPINKLDYQTRLPFSLHYATPETLGSDRIAAVAAAYGRFPGQNVLVIDMGTCITYDLITSKGDYLGGGISPGIQMRFKAMHHFTGRLPLAFPIDHAKLIGKSTEGSLQSGVMNGVEAEIEGIISKYGAVYEDLTVLIGGGDNKYFDKQLKNNIFAASNLVIEGLKVISEFNEHQ
jgi:type III pantothenate kinase